MILNPFPKRYKVTELSTSFFPLMFLMTMLRDEIYKRRFVEFRNRSLNL
ncbi:hypothetical protein LEP1GSC162_0031 [Leptospira santarosai str. CBC1531]|nr:hypothetical protein LEP1GSC076_3866 [Leptospira sp. Fiocruz LV4135]EMO85581.1 hypothetical protein LEP1GSC070_3940 [Leptospira santarosai str. AIM]EMP82291.1 hypothetical protein LEP1GSC162_0031 [Leptospira santarosai str. CBC1531]